ncbi:MAG: HD domain-containing protein [Chloroflexi bacterium]|nr:HD domain-containing protein [Chloroflexota bacterium]
MSGWYRLRQFWQNVAARPLTAVAQSEVSAQLTPAEMTLFQHFSNSDQWHSYRVMKTLQAANHIHPDLLTAALLHDVGKTRVPLSVWERSWVVVGQVIWPKKTAVWGQDAPLGWKRPFVVKAQHPAWGADMAAAAGSSELAVGLIRRHQDTVPETAVSEMDHLLRHLQWADNQN